MTESADTSNPLVLLVDDDVNVHRLINAKLRAEPIRLVGVTSGPVALEMVRSDDPPALVLMDLDLPDMDGFEVIRRMKEDPRTGQIPVIVLSAMSESRDKVSAFEIGATDYVTKPFDSGELRARVRSALRLRSLMNLLEERAETDGLTGLWNRAHFNRRWAEAVEQSSRYNSPLALMLIDIDNFKRVNDTCGHLAGDEAIQGLARLLQTECRGADVACRYGGEEFAVIMGNTPPDNARAVAERIRIAFSELVWPRHPEQRLTFSAGLAGAAGRSSLDHTEWVGVADQNLYRAKSAGRNRVVCTDLTNNDVSLSRAAS